MQPSCNLVTHNCHPVIPKGHVKCYACCGTGVLVRSFHYKAHYMLCDPCPICYGYGYIDWVKAALRPSMKDAYKKFLYNRAMANRYSSLYYKMWGGYKIPLKCPTNKKCKVIRTIAKRFNRFKKEHPKYRWK